MYGVGRLAVLRCSSGRDRSSDTPAHLYISGPSPGREGTVLFVCKEHVYPGQGRQHALN